MKKLTLQLITLIIALFSIVNNAKAQTTVTINPSLPWVAYVNCFDLANTYQWGSSWALPDVKSTIVGSTVTLQPNFNTYANNPGDPYWQNGAIGNKNLELNTFQESTSLIGQTVTFIGTVSSNTMSGAYTKTAFVKALDPNNGYSTVVYQTVALPASGPFSVSAIIPNTAGLIVQYGFTIYGINANPAAEAALGSVVINKLFPLPLSLTSFDAKSINESVQLNWITKSEVNVNSFNVEKSLDGKTFEILANVKATNNETNEYSMTDNNFLNTTYYRLKMIDEDGKFSYSEVEKVIKLQDDMVSLYPNPSSSSINIISKNQSAIMYSILGNAIQKVKLNDGITNIDISTLKAGNYFIQFSKGQIVNFTKK